MPRPYYKLVIGRPLLKQPAGMDLKFNPPGGRLNIEVHWVDAEAAHQLLADLFAEQWADMLVKVHDWMERPGNDDWELTEYKGADFYAEVATLKNQPVNEETS